MASEPSNGNGLVTPVLDFPLGQRVQAVRVDYEPGAGTPGSHSHPYGAFVYVIEGSVRMGLRGEAPQTLTAGDAWYEPPGAVHAVSENASETEAASLLAVFVLPEGQAPAVAAA